MTPFIGHTPSSSVFRRTARTLTILFGLGMIRNLHRQTMSTRPGPCVSPAHKVFWSKHSRSTSFRLRSSSYCKSALMPARHSSLAIANRAPRSTPGRAWMYTSHRCTRSAPPFPADRSEATHSGCPEAERPLKLVVLLHQARRQPGLVLLDHPRQLATIRSASYRALRAVPLTRQRRTCRRRTRVETACAARAP